MRRAGIKVEFEFDFERVIGFEFDFECVIGFEFDFECVIASAIQKYTILHNSNFGKSFI